MIDHSRGRANAEYIATHYNAYQRKYATQIRESDRVLVELIRRVTDGRDATVLDIGCSTGNFLRHLNRLAPGLELVGGDVTPEVLEDNRQDPELAGIAFETLDLLDLPRERFDVVVANAVLAVFDDTELDRAAASISGALRPGGAFLAFDWLHPYEQNLSIREVSEHLDVMLYFRPYSLVRRLFEAAGLDDVEFHPFELPIDLERPADPADLTSYTVRSAEGGRLAFRGVLCQPWCHFVARKPA